MGIRKSDLFIIARPPFKENIYFEVDTVQKLTFRFVARLLTRVPMHCTLGKSVFGQSKTI